MKILYFLVIYLFVATHVFAVNSVNPTGVNVNSTGVTSVFLTFRGTAGQISKDAFWCGEISVSANTVTATNPCVSGTFFGRLPKTLAQTSPSLGVSNQPNTDLNSKNLGMFRALNTRHNKKNLTQGNNQNFTDVMTIPASVARRAMQSARAGSNSSFFYVRKFEAAGSVQYIAVTCRMSNGGARVPFALTEVHPYFVTEQGKQSVYLASQGRLIPDIQAEISFNGTGRLKGRWEIVMPGDVEPSEFDLVPEANLPIEQRALQKRYTLLQRFDVFLPPKGKTTLKGPDVQLVPNQIIGPYQIILRIEATRDKEGDSNTGLGVSINGGVSGFSMPSLRYYVATEDDVLHARVDAGLSKSITLFEPSNESQSSNLLRFSWLAYASAKTYKLEVKSQDEALFRALIDGRKTYYQSPPWIAEQINTSPSQWRVAAYDIKGNKVALSQWRKYELVLAQSTEEE
jgi:hypothetical protein